MEEQQAASRSEGGEEQQAASRSGDVEWLDGIKKKVLVYAGEICSLVNDSGAPYLPLFQVSPFTTGMRRKKTIRGASTAAASISIDASLRCGSRMEKL